MKEARPNIYAATSLDRLGLLREDKDFYTRHLADSANPVLIFWRGKHLVTPEGEPPRTVCIDITQLQSLLPPQEMPILLGRYNEKVIFAVDFSAYETPPFADRGRYEDLRTIGLLLSQKDAALCAYARGLFNWHRGHLFCGTCGATTEPRHAGHQRQCTNPACGTVHFPRTDPAVIMLVTDGEHVVLGRQAVWTKGQHSVLAGFVEPGESLEDAVRRETFEEVGLVVTNVRYCHSQPWPFPLSLMVGFIAEVATNSPIHVDRHELETARWYSRDELLASPENDTFRLPRRDSISWRLIDDWIKNSPG